MIHEVLNTIPSHYKLQYPQWFTLRVGYVTRSVKQDDNSVGKYIIILDVRYSLLMVHEVLYKVITP